MSFSGQISSAPLLTTCVLLNQPPLPSLVALTIACLYFVYCLSVVCTHGVLGYKLSVGKGQNLQSILQNTYISVNILAWSKYLLKHALQLSKRSFAESDCKRLNAALFFSCSVLKSLSFFKMDPYGSLLKDGKKESTKYFSALRLFQKRELKLFFSSSECCLGHTCGLSLCENSFSQLGSI